MKKYSLSLDIIRIISAFFVVFSHTTDIFVLYAPFSGSFSWQVVYYLNTLSRTAVPLFVILSGYLILDFEKTKNLKEFYKKRFSRVFVPLIFWVPTYFLWAHIWGGVALTKDFIIKIIWTGDFWHLYFLVIIMELYLISPWIAKHMMGNRRKETMSFIALTVFSIFCAVLLLLPGHIDLRNNLFTMFIPYIGFFYAGAYFRKINISKIQSIILLVSFLILGVVANVIAKGDTNAFIIHNYAPPLLFMSFAIFLAFKNVEKFITPKTVKQLTRFIMPISLATFGIYLIHYAVLDVVRDWLHLYPWQIHTPIIFFAILPAIITFAICTVVVLLLRKIPYSKWLIG